MFKKVVKYLYFMLEVCIDKGSQRQQIEINTLRGKLQAVVPRTFSIVIDTVSCSGTPESRPCVYRNFRGAGI